MGLENVGQIANYNTEGGEAPGFDGGIELQFCNFYALEASPRSFNPRIMTSCVSLRAAAATAFNNAIPGGQRPRAARAPR